jgi:hypothetical protein
VKASLATVAIALLVLGAGCGDDGGGGGGDDASESSSGSAVTTTEPTGTPAADLSSYDTIANLHDDLVAGGVTCELEYEGLTDDDGNEVSTCTIDGNQAFLSIFADPTTVDEVVTAHEADADVALAYGANWTIELTPPSEATATSAAAIAEATGGATPDA